MSCIINTVSIEGSSMVEGLSVEIKKRIEKAEEMIRNSKGLPSVPTVLSEALRITADPSVSFDKVVKIISQDPNLSGRLLRIANSPYYGLRHRVTNLHLALVILGIREFRCILIGSAVLDMMKFKNLKHQELYKKLWKESLFMASFCKQLSNPLNLKYEGEDFLVGLLANIGSSLLLNEMSQKYYEIINQTNNNHQKQLELELEILGFTQSDVAYVFLKNWNIPPLLSDTIWRQFDTEYLKMEEAIDPKLTALLRLARYALIELNEGTFYKDTIEKSFQLLENSYEGCKNLWEETKSSKQYILSLEQIDLDNLFQ